MKAATQCEGQTAAGRCPVWIAPSATNRRRYCDACRARRKGATALPRGVHAQLTLARPLPGDVSPATIAAIVETAHLAHRPWLRAQRLFRERQAS